MNTSGNNNIRIQAVGIIHHSETYTTKTTNFLVSQEILPQRDKLYKKEIKTIFTLQKKQLRRCICTFNSRQGCKEPFKDLKY